MLVSQITRDKTPTLILYRISTWLMQCVTSLVLCGLAHFFAIFLLVFMLVLVFEVTMVKYLQSDCWRQKPKPLSTSNETAKSDSNSLICNVFFFSFLFFFICSFVTIQACDASILLQSHESTCKSEMESSRNFGVKKLEVINHIKSILEITCPGQVSCADIIALAAKESVFITGGPEIKIPLGRKDSVTCSSSQLADTKLPAAGIAVDELLRISKSFGMNLEESVAILGNGHNGL